MALWGVAFLGLRPIASLADGGIGDVFGVRAAGVCLALPCALGAAAILVAAVGYAAGPMVLKAKLRELDARTAMGASLAVAAVMLTPVAALDPPRAVP